MNNTLKISSWNVRGFGDPFWGWTVSRWVNRFHRDLDIIYLQEIKAQQNRIDFQLSSLLWDGKFVVDYAKGGRAGATIGVFSNLRVTDQGTKGDGCFAWCTVETSVGQVSIGLVYAPNECANCKDLWD